MQTGAFVASLAFTLAGNFRSDKQTDFVVVSRAARSEL
jgi:hypothetical protein